MSDPVILETGKSTTFPTWAGGGITKLFVNALAGDAQVRVNAGAAFESVSATDKETASIERSWGGLVIGVTNEGLSLVKVWTT